MEYSQEQSKAIMHESGPRLVLAGPGSGKTTVMIHRVRYLIEKCRIPEEQILVITYTKAAATEMEQRFYSLMGRRNSGVTFGTFHAVFFHILQRSTKYTAADILRESERYRCIISIFQKLSCASSNAVSGMQPHQCKPVSGRQLETEEIKQLLDEISRCKNSLQTAEEFSKRTETSELFLPVFREYERHRTEEGKLDFDDMLLECYQMLFGNAKERACLQQRYRYILVDEFQDVNLLQYKSLQLLAEPERNLFVVGDDDQSIYAFRGAEPGLVQQFRRDYPEAAVSLLGINFRSAECITKAADRMICRNQNRMKKKLTSQSGHDGRVTVLRFSGKREQYRGLIQLLMDSGIPKSEQAVLFRTNRQPRPLARILQKENIPFTLRESPASLLAHWISQDLLAYLRIAAGEEERSLYLRVINRPNRYIARAHFPKAEVNQTEVLQSLSGKPTVFRNARRLFTDLKLLKNMNPFAAVMYIRNGIGYDRFLEEYAVEHSADYEELLDIIDEFTEYAKEAENVEQLMELLRETEDSFRAGFRQQKDKPVKRLEEGVSLMTFHASKGLEFRRVFVIDLNDGVVPHRKSKTTGALEEERRLLYVAMTRAKEELYLCYTEKNGGRAALPSRFLHEL